jgi:phage terminase large subunit-like protein
MILSGRGWGKTRCGAEWIVWEALKKPKTRWAVIARTSADIRDTCFEGESGIISVLRRYGVYDEKKYNRTNNSYILPNGSRIKGFSAEEPDRLRGPQHHGAWCDELAAWDKPDSWDQLQFGLRLGQHPQTVVTTTPQPIPVIRNLIQRDSTFLTRGSTFENEANLAPSALAELQLRYHGTRLGRQELYGEILDDVEGALWNREMIESARIRLEDLPPLIRIVVAIDPAVTSGENSDDTGIVVAGVTASNEYYVLDDRTCHVSPEQWAKVAVTAYNDWKADRIIAETNNGGDMVELVLRNVAQNIPVTKVTASRGKRVRAEPISALYEQGRVHHVGGFDLLEDQMCQWIPDSGNSPDRMDALVWALSELSANASALVGLANLAVFCPKCKFPSKKGTAICLRCGTHMETKNDN